MIQYFRRNSATSFGGVYFKAVPVGAGAAFLFMAKRQKDRRYNQ